MIEGKREQ